MHENLNHCSPELVVAKKSEDHTPLHVAAENGHDKIVEKLLAHSPGLINAQGSDLKTALYLAIERGHDLVVAQLMRYNPNFELEAMIVVREDYDDDYEYDDDGGYGCNEYDVGDDYDDFCKKRARSKLSAVELAVEKGREEVVHVRDDYNYDEARKKRTWQSKSAIYLAVEKGHDKIVALLLAREPSSTANVRDCLHCAVKAGHTNIVAQLLAHSPATVNAMNHMQQSALHFAAESGQSVEIAELLLAAKALIDAVDRRKISALHRAVDKARTGLVELLLAHKALVNDNRDDGCGYDPLIFRPVIDGHSRIVALLLAHSPQLLDARTKRDGLNALHFATDPEIVQQLLSVRPTLLEERSNGVRRSPLRMAIENNRDRVLAQMLAQCPGAAELFRKERIFRYPHPDPPVPITEFEILDVAFNSSNEQTLEVLLAHKPELIHVNLRAGMLLHCVLWRHTSLSQAFIVKVWELNKQAVHVFHKFYPDTRDHDQFIKQFLDQFFFPSTRDKETPFHIALRRRLDWAIEMMQGQLSFDEIVEACKQTKTSQDRFRPKVIIEQLSADVREVVCEYLGFESARKRASATSNKFIAEHVEHGHEEVLDLLARSGSEDRTPLHFAAENGHDKIVEKLLAHSPGLINAQGSDLKTALYLAIERGHDLVVAQLMRFNPNFELEAMIVVRGDDDDYDYDEPSNEDDVGDDYDYGEAFCKKRTWPSKSEVELAVEKKVVHVRSDDDDARKKRVWQSKSAIYLAVEKGHDKVVALLLAREPAATANVRDCLHCAVKAGHTNIVAQLLAHSPASVNAVNHMQQRALHLAVESGRSVEIAELLLAANAAIDAADQDKSSALHRAVDKGRTELVELLLARKALVTDNRDCDDYDPLIFRPVIASHEQIVAMLLAHSPQLLDARRKRDGLNALHCATDSGIVQQLLSVRPALLEERSNRNGVTPLRMAVENNRDRVLAQMLEQCPGAAQEELLRDWTIPHAAFAWSNEQTLEVLLAHKPELVHTKMIAGTLLHCVLHRHACLSQAFITKVWELNKQAVHVVDRHQGTPFHIALRKGLDWAIEMMQGQLSFDEVVEACKQTNTSRDRFKPNVIIEQLADVTEVVEYLGFESARKRVGKRARDD